MSKVSVIVPVYNVKMKYFDECVDSIISQTYKDIELILVDDGATLELRKKCDDLALVNDRIIVIHQENKGASAARNAGLLACSGEYVTFVDSDDYIDKSTVETAVDSLEKSNLDLLLWGSYKCYKDRNEKYMPYDDDIEVFSDELKEQLQFKTMVGQLSFYLEPATKYGSGSCCSKLYKTSFLKENDLKYPEGIKRAEDVNFNIRVFDKAKRIGYLNRHFYYYRQLDSSATYIYRKNGIEVFTDALLCLKSFLEEENKSDLFWQVFYMRCIFFFLESMDMDYLNPQNKEPFSKRLKAMKEVLGTEPYNMAVKKLDVSYLDFKRRIPVYLMKGKSMLLLALFYKVYRMIS